MADRHAMRRRGWVGTSDRERLSALLAAARQRGDALELRVEALEAWRQIAESALRDLGARVTALEGQ